MQLILVRHADAVALGQPGADTDAVRPLTALGHEQAAALADWFAAKGVAVSAVVTSPLLRARQTADPLLRLLPDSACGPTVSDLLAPDALKKKKLSKLVDGLHADTVVLVGHNPDLSTYAAWLLGAGAASVPLEKAAAAAFRVDEEVEKGEALLEWLVTPLVYLGDHPAR